jgi:hypothetical protein
LKHLEGKTIAKLDLSSAENLTTASIKIIASLNGLQEFKAPYTRFGPELLDALATQPQLTSVDLRLTRIPSRDIRSWADARPQIKVTY